ncbi:MAG TPA: hypothetical protein P5328_02940 [Candidatus Paceibacterota bacterium]|nr:hypothetical protein [Candidatus Paceibacterota bacterium]HRZ34394.1 hypothetical protein [Candidatus Paceibacterota bacterium]
MEGEPKQEQMEEEIEYGPVQKILSPNRINEILERSNSNVIPGFEPGEYKQGPRLVWRLPTVDEISGKYNDKLSGVIDLFWAKDGDELVLVNSQNGNVFRGKEISSPENHSLVMVSDHTIFPE